MKGKPNLEQLGERINPALTVSLSGGVLFVGGTNGNDTILIQESSPTQLTVEGNTFDKADVDEIVVIAADGERIVRYVRDNPRLLLAERPNVEAAKELGIALVEKWSGEFSNTVTTVGKNLALDTYLAGSSYTVTGPYMGLISSASYSAIAAADTMSSHSGWLEAGNANAPTYSGSRKTAAWSSASSGSKALSSALSFSITGTGTVKGCFLVYGSGASATVDNTGGTLYSAGLFSGGDRAVISGDTLNVSYTASL